jgi:hypothetical protein
MKNPLSWLAICLVFLVISGCQKDNDVENKVPVANAGPSRTFTLPGDTLTLTGSGTDADGHIVAYSWNQVSGPAATVIVNPGSPSTLVKGFLPGNYVFQLLVTDDKGATGADTASVVVNQALPQTVTIAPSNNPTEVEVAVLNGVDQSGTGAGRVDMPVEAWTNGAPLFVREVIKFDLSSIPANATITAANLYLYSYPNPTLNGNLVDANFGTSNALIIQQVTSNWSTSTINWFNQPVTATNNQIVSAATSQSVLDLNIDVTGMVGQMVNNNSNFGFMLKLQNEVTYNSRIFVGSYNTTYPAKHPKLVITYH